MTLCIILTLAVLSFRLFVQNHNSFGGAVAGGIANALYIMIMNQVRVVLQPLSPFTQLFSQIWSKVALKLTDWGAHPCGCCVHLFTHAIYRESPHRHCLQ